jgi:hypothetical protein
MPVNDLQSDFGRDGVDPASANHSAAGIVRNLAAQLERANFSARSMRPTEIDNAERIKRLEFALTHLASVMSDVEVLGLVNALRHTADTAQEDHYCEFCGNPVEPWAILTGDPGDDEEDGAELLTHHRWDQYGVTLCKSCHFSVRQARWQLSTQM